MFVTNAFKDVVTVDGASGSGKTTLLTALDTRYRALPVEFGPVVRTVAWWAKHHRMTVADAVALMALMDGRGELSIASPGSALLAASEIVLGGTPMRQRIFSSTLNEAVATTAHDPAAVAWVSGLVRARIRGRRATVSGRQAATIVCPDAGLRIRLEARASVRARRKTRQLSDAGLAPRWSDDAHLLATSAQPDVLIDTTARTVDEVAQVVFRCIETRLGWQAVTQLAALPSRESVLMARMPATTRYAPRLGAKP